MKFINLLKKELAELCNLQMFLGLIISVMIFALMGGVLRESMDSITEEAKKSEITISDRDDTEFTKTMLDALEESGYKLKKVDSEGDAYADILKNNDVKNLLIIPEGFTKNIESRKSADIISVSRLESASITTNISSLNSSASEAIGNYISIYIKQEGGLTLEDIAVSENPINMVEKTVVSDKSADITPTSVVSKISMQNTMLPIIIFVLIIMCSNTLISAISNEKIDKTLETLLSAPVSRLSVIGAKMLAAAIVALINAVVYMLSFSYCMNGLTDSMDEELKSELVNGYVSVETAIAQLGLSLGFTDYILIGLQLFFTILICLSISLILGALVNDTKSSQTVIMPIMMLAMIPYIVSMFTDINTLPAVLKYIMYAIPFTHTFSAIPNLMFGHTSVFFIGLVYQIILFVVTMFFALKLFTSDKLFTISLNFGQKSKYKKKGRKGAAEEE